jgi:phosphoribosylanthranilate isomerase
VDKIITKVDRVSTIEEAIKLQELDVDIIGISLSKNINFIDNRDIGEDAALEIIKALNKAKSVVEISVNNNLNQILDMIKKLEVDYIKKELE